MRMGSFAALGVVLSTGCGSQNGSFAEDSWTVLSDQIERVSISIDLGSVSVIGTELPGARVETRVHWTDNERPQVLAEVVDGVLNVYSTCPQFSSITRCRVEQIIEVPRNVPVLIEIGVGSVQVNTFTDAIMVDVGQGDVLLEKVHHYGWVQSLQGDILVKNSHGDFDLYTQAGDIYGRSLKGLSLNANTNEGSITALYTESPVSVFVKSGEGSIRIQVPDDGTDYAIDALTDDGTVDVALESFSDAKRTISAITGSGDVEVSSH